jgi:hypothetical protein
VDHQVRRVNVIDNVCDVVLQQDVQNLAEASDGADLAIDQCLHLAHDVSGVSHASFDANNNALLLTLIVDQRWLHIRNRLVEILCLTAQFFDAHNVPQ